MGRVCIKGVGTLSAWYTPDDYATIRMGTYVLNKLDEVYIEDIL